MTLQVDLPAHQQEFIDTLVAEGVYKNASEAIADGLRRIERERAEYAAKLDRLRAEVKKGFDDIDEGRYIDFDSFEELEAFIADLGTKAAERVASRR